MSASPQEQTPNSSPGAAALWVAVLASPIAWFTYFSGAFALAPEACGHLGKTVIWVVALAAILLIAAAGTYSWKTCKAFSREREPRRPQADNRRTMTMGGIALSGFFLIVMLAQLIPNLLIGGCE